MTRLDLPEPETPVTQMNLPSGKRTSIVLQVVLARADDDQLLAVAGPARSAARGCGARRAGTGRVSDVWTAA